MAAINLMGGQGGGVQFLSSAGAYTAVPGSATSGVPMISQGASSAPTFGTAVVAGGGTGKATLTAYGLLAGGTTATGALQQITDSATNRVLIAGGGSALPSFSAYPQISGLGIGASPGSTAGLTFDGSSFLSTYVALTSWTPVLNFGGGTTGITYTTQTGTYIRIGTLTFFSCRIVLSNKGSSTGNVSITGLPTNANGTQTFNVYFNLLTFTGTPSASISNGSSSILLGSYATTGNLTSFTDTNFANTTTIICSGFYINS